MLTIAFAVLTAAVLLGLYLATTYLGLLPAPPWLVGAIHGAAGATGLGILILSLGGPLRGVEYGVQSFGKIATAILAAALAGGLSFAALRYFAKRSPGWLVAGHATVAILGYAFLMAYLSLG